eukprot:TRINITY_DN1019_c0_g1_i2.p1 TRINITY_DN1019_c0_g1~~TRINITY_DN1019_c0_g1_i2.p1  ORF type:complete len:146 (+),score=10.90 TRINITY_DN1019_c0_g1_i2:142-579(+)
MKLIILLILFVYGSHSKFSECNHGLVSELTGERNQTYNLAFINKDECKSCLKTLQKEQGLKLFDFCVQKIHTVVVHELSPQDHCCTVWDNLKCGVQVADCIQTCEQGVDACISCLGPVVFNSCCCCLQNDIPIRPNPIKCSTCCT